MNATCKAIKWALIITAVTLAAPIVGVLLAIGLSIYILKILFQMEIDDANNQKRDNESSN